MKLISKYIFDEVIGMYVFKYSDVVIVIIKKCRNFKLIFNKVKLFILFLFLGYSVLIFCN